MVRISIRCHPAVPVAADELEGWLERQVDELRAAAPDSIIRLSRLIQSSPDVDMQIGWLVELELAEGEPVLNEGGLDEALRDMRLLGLQPSMLLPSGESVSGQAAAGLACLRAVRSTAGHTSDRDGEANGHPGVPGWGL